MRNHDQKIKDIQRSVLPSTTGKYAREQRRIIHKQNRSRERDSFSAARQIFNADIDADIHLDFDEGRATRNMNEMVWNADPVTRSGRCAIGRSGRSRPTRNCARPHFTSRSPSSRR